MNWINELRRLVGADGLLEQAPDMEAYLTDWRGRFRGRAVAVAHPRTTQQTAQIVQLCAHHSVPIVVQGGNTGLVGGATPDDSGKALVLCTRRMDRVRQIDTAEDTITVEAGCLLQRVQEAALARNRLFPLSLGSQGSCTIGGNLATNAGGTQVLRYGNARELTLGLEVVLASGEVWNGLRGLRKDNSGYDLKQLFIGSEGTLGVITAATLKLFALPRTRVVCLLALPDLGAAIGVLQRARDAAGPALTAFEVMSGACVRLVERVLGPQRRPFDSEYPWLALLEWSEHEDESSAVRRCERLCASAIEAKEAFDAIISRSLSDCASLWRIREAIPEAQARSGGNVKHDISLPLATMELFVAQTEAALRVLSPQLQALVFGHLGDGNLHFNVGTQERSPVRVAFELEAQINEIVYSAVRRCAGSISAEHGLGQLRRDLARQFKQPLELEMMRGIKQVLDPQGLLNPGKVI
ncbi:MAG TPA: FAD-binding oxidoreductase [Burkholderiaceae bacterium]|nr:FAD-binding oxidoreductase [Burkholderiaceae bacterium]